MGMKEAAAHQGLELPTQPRFTLESLREINIAPGDGETTVAHYAFIHKGKRREKYVAFEDLTHGEREAALCFILKHGEGRTKRKTPVKPQQPITAEDLPPIDLETLEPVPQEGTGEGTV